MSAAQKIKNNLFLVIVVLSYALLAVVKPDIAVASAKNSVYYFKEMLLIMPVVFLLTALLDAWVPKETIIKYLGSESKGKGLFLSFAMGSISAGPVYSAFPICVMLLKKGASVRNIVIILSSWAVIKIPMLINEVKFLGLTFMAIRWILTVLAILCFSYITDKMVKKKDMPLHAREEHGIALQREFCMGCSLCAKSYPELFVMQGKKATVNDALNDIDLEKLESACSACPCSAIRYTKEQT